MFKGLKMKNIRPGDRIYHIYHMSNKGVVQEIYEVPARAGNGAGPFSKMRRVEFLSELDGKIHDIKIEEAVKDN